MKLNIVKSIFLISLVFSMFLSFQNINSQSMNEDPEDLIKEAKQLLTEAKYSEAEKLFQSALKLDKFIDEAYYNLALIYAMYAQVATDEDSKTQLVSKIISYLNYAVSTGFRDENMLIREKNFEVIRNLEEYSKILKDIEYLKIKEGHWIDTAPFVINIKFPKDKETGSKLPFLIYLKSDSSLENKSFNPTKYVEDYSMVCAELSYSTGETDVRGGKWTEFTEKRIRKTLEEIKEKNNLSSFIDFNKVYICGIRQGGYRALVSYLSYNSVFSGVFVFNTPLFSNSDAYNKFSELKDKKDLRIYAVHSKTDSLSFEKSQKSWVTLTEAGFPVQFKIEEGQIFGNKTIKEYEQTIFNFINKDIPINKKSAEQPQTQENKPEEDTTESENDGQ